MTLALDNSHSPKALSSLAALLGLRAQLEVLRALDRHHALGIALGALEHQHELS